MYIDNSYEFTNKEKEIYLPQNKEYVNTGEMVVIISEAHSKKIRLVTLFNQFINLIDKKVKIISQVHKIV